MQTDNTETIINNAIKQLNANNNREALCLFEQIDSKKPDIPNLNYGKALAFARLGQMEDAKGSLNDLLSAVPNHKRGLELLSELCSSNNFEDKHPPDNISKQVLEMMNQASEFLNASEHVKAMRAAMKATSFGVDVPGMNYLLCCCLNNVGRHEEALEAAKAELLINPEHAETKAQIEWLTKALEKPKKQKIPTKDRHWGTTLPPETLDSIQNASHNYSYKGVPMIKNPFDFAIYPLLIWHQKPRTIIEIGTKDGASALWFGDMLDNYGIDGHIYSIDIVKVTRLSHQRVTFMEGDGRALQETLSEDFIRSLPRPLLIIEDADHSYETSKHVLEYFHPYIRAGEYIVIEDGIISDLCQDQSFNSGPHKALKEFLTEYEDQYVIDDEYCDFFGYNLTWCTNGFLKKTASNVKFYSNNPVSNIAAPCAEQNNAEKCEILHKCLETDPAPYFKNSELNKYFPLNTGNTEFEEIFINIKPYTSLNKESLFALYSITQNICVNNMPGNFLEISDSGIGTAALLAVVVKLYSKQPRRLYHLKSDFSGSSAYHPDGSTQNRSYGKNDSDDHDLQYLSEKLGVLNIVKSLKGNIDSLTSEIKSKIGMISFVHFDGDDYDSKKAALNSLYDKINIDGVILISGYNSFEGCKKAISEFETYRKTIFEIMQIDDENVWFYKKDGFPLNRDISPETVYDFNKADPVCCGIESQMSINERFQLYYAVRHYIHSISSPIKFIEVGSFAGASLMTLYKAFKHITPLVQGYSVDPSNHPQLQEVIKETKGDVQHLKMPSEHAAPMLKKILSSDGSPAELIFIDGDHSYEGVKKDILDYFPLLASGGIMVFHDYLPPIDEDNCDAIFFHHAGTEPGIRKACKELMEDMYQCQNFDLPLLYPTDQTQTQSYLPVIPGVFSTIKAYRKA